MSTDYISEPPAKKICLVNNTSSKYEEIGVNEYMNYSDIGFSGTIKERWEDFIVNEVNLNKEVVVFSTKDIEVVINDTIKIDDSLIKSEYIEKLNKARETSEKCEIVFEAPEDKEERKMIHNYIKSAYPRFSANTETQNNKRVFVILNYEDERSKISKRNAKKSGLGEYCQFVCHKEGIDTISAVGLISKHLRMKPTNFTYAGTKDKRGITSQMISVRGCAAERIRGLNKCLRNIYVGNFRYSERPLKLGDLYGNRFKLVIRDIQPNNEKINEIIDNSIKQLSKNGFINYFGLQRFGSSENARSHDIGRMAIAGNWEGVIDAIMTVGKHDLPDMRAAKEEYWNNGRDIKTFLSNTGGYNIERTLMTGVEKHGYKLNAIDCLPRNLKQLYVHSYQSYVWNQAASYRITLSKDVIIGDLIQINEEDEIHVVKDEEDASKYSLTDVVLPLPGFDIQLPQNKVGEWFEENLRKDNLSLAQLKHRVKDFSLPGAYRKLAVIPDDINHTIHKYEDASVSLIETDKDRVESNFVMPPSEGTKLALILQLTLPKSCYATVALRELMKSESIVQ